MSLSRRRFIRYTAAAGAAAALPRWAGSAQAAPASKPNVLFIAVDDLRPELGCYGRTQMHTPHIDRLAASGTRFDRAYCQVAVCGASRGSLLTGLRPDSTGFYRYDIHVRKTLPDVLTLPQHFQQHGYQTAKVGKIYHHDRDDAASWDRLIPRALSAYALPENAERMKAFYAWRKNKKGPNPRNGPACESADLPDEAYRDGYNAAHAVELLRGFQQESPFFLAVGFYKPHLPFACPSQYWDLYDRGAIDLADHPFKPKDAPDIAMHNWGELRQYAGIPSRGRLNDDQARELIHGYYACTSFTDAQVGKVLGELDRLGLADNTIVILWGDHGWHLGDQGLWCKHSNFETAVRVPMIVRAPGREAGRATPALTEFVDIYPTLCDLAGLPTPGHLEGTSFAPLLDDPLQSWKTAAFSQYVRGNRYMGYSLAADHYRFTRWQSRTDPNDVIGVELYDHQADPGESVNVADHAEYAQTRARLSAMLDRGWRGALPASFATP